MLTLDWWGKLHQAKALGLLITKGTSSWTKVQLINSSHRQTVSLRKEEGYYHKHTQPWTHTHTCTRTRIDAKWIIMVMYSNCVKNLPSYYKGNRGKQTWTTHTHTHIHTFRRETQKLYVRQAIYEPRAWMTPSLQNVFPCPFSSYIVIPTSTKGELLSAQTCFTNCCMLSVLDVASMHVKNALF